MCLRPLFAFFTIYPVKSPVLDFRCVWALPYVVAPAVAAPAAFAFHMGAGPYVSYAILLLVTGLHHLDGLADVADAMMVRDRERARRVLEDPRKGTAGVFAIVVTILIAAGSAADPLQLVWAEVFSKATTVVFAAFSKPFKPGMGEAFINAARRQWPAALPALATALYINPSALAAFVITALLYIAAYRHLGGANGDVMGYLLEISRVLYIAV